MEAFLALDDLHGSRRFMAFLGRDTTGSLAVSSFPAWMRLFDADCELVGLNMPADSSNQAYVNLLRRLAESKGCIGMQVTNHKVRLYHAAHQCFDRCSSDVNLLEEVGGVVVSDGRLVAVSPDATGLRTKNRYTRARNR